MIKNYVKNFLSYEIIQAILARIFFVCIKFIHLTTKVEYRNVEKLKDYMKDGKPIILVFWHSRSLLISKFWSKILGMKKHPIYGIFSTHRDGRLVGNVFSLLGVKNIASSSKSVVQASGVAMKSMRLLKSGISIGFTPDGPLGPRMNFVSDSAFLFAKASGVPVVPVCISAKKSYVLNNWDRYMVVRPFHKAVIEVGDFLFIDKKISDSEFVKMKKEFEKNMVDNTLRLDKEMEMPEILPASKK